MKIYHNEEFIGNSLDAKSAFTVIKAYLDIKDYNPYYYRQWLDEDGTTVIDYGSHDDFFYLKED